MAKEKKAESHRLTADLVDTLFKNAENVTDMRQQLVNVNYFLGNQWIGWNSARKSVQPLPAEDSVLRVTRNRIRPRVMSLLSKHIKNKLKFDVIPGSREQSDIDAAKAADKYLSVLWNELSMTQKTRELFLFMIVQKRAWIKTWFDAEAGEDISPTEDDEFFDDWVESGAESVHEGTLRSKVCDPLTVHSDPSAKTEEDIRWVMERYAKDIDEIKEEYGVEVAADTNVDYLNKFDIARGESRSQNKLSNMAIVTELWYKPCAKYPNGAMITVANGKEIYYNENSGELPYQLFGYIPVPGSLLYDAIVTDLIDPQKEINVLRSMIATHARRMGNSIWTRPVGSNADDDMLTNETGGIIDYVPVNGAKPERISAPDIPSFYSQELAQNALDIDDMSGSREVSQGRLPAGLDTLGGLELMVEQENEKLSVASQNYEQGMKKVMQRILRLLKSHYTEERQGRLLGEDNEIELIAFNGADLTGYEDINIVQGSSLPEMKAAQQERIMTMWGAGAIVKKDGTPDPAKLLRLMGMGESTELFEQEALDSNNAKMENKAFEDLAEDPEFPIVMQAYQMELQKAQQLIQMNGITPESATMPQLPPGIPQIWDSDDDEIHIQIHNNFRKSSRYREMTPEMRALVDQHYQSHVDRVEAPMMAQQQAQQQAQEAQAEQAQMEQQSQMEMKQMDQQAALQRDQMKVEGQIAVASMK